ncbi:MAG: clostripain-related cysteine peptidase [Prevotellaceae bacterium]|nr:clostripain-related cysteine peptidase [Prevotellaceae bacterium]
MKESVSCVLQCLSFLAMSLVLSLSLTACSDDESNDDHGGKHIAEYTIMIYGCGGTTLDASTIYNLFYPLMAGGCNDDVNITFLFKCSAEYQTSEIKAKGMKFEGARRWAAPKEGVFKWDSTLVADPESVFEYDKWIIDATAYLEPYSEKIGGVDFKLSDPKNLTDFINWNVEKYPAKKYILLMKDHGSGWDFYDDRGIPSSRAQIFDDVFDCESSDYGVSIFNAVEGIRSSKIHKVDAIISDECLMATMEVLNEYAAVTDLNMAAQENTRSQFGNHILDAFKKGAKNGQPLKDILRYCVDRYVEAYDKGYMSDQGVYDLTKISSLNAPVRSVAEFFVDKENEGDTDWESIKLEAICNTLCANSLRDYLYLYLNTQEMMERWTELSEDERSEALGNIAMINESHSGFCLYDFMSNVVAIAQAYKEASNPAGFANDLETFKGYLKEYDRALRDMSYINCTSKKSDDEPYQYTSPSVILQSLKEGVYGPVSAQNIYGYSNADKISREDALALYKRLTFDKETNWSALLVGLQKSATPFEGGDRMLRFGTDY